MTLDRWELLRMLGAAAGDPGAARAAGAVLGLPPCGDTEHAEVFAVNCPPYASVYLGAASTGRLAAFWAAAGLGVPPEPDHLTTLLGLYARLGAAAPEPGQLRPAHLRPAHLRPAQLRPAQLRPAQLRPAELRQTLFREYLWPWLPAFLGAVSDLPAGAMTPWAELTLCALRRERELDGGWDGPLPLALRQAPPAGADGGPGELLDRLTTPLRSGIILTRRAVAAGADRVRGRAADRERAASPGRHAGRRAGAHGRLAGGRGGPLVATAPGHGPGNSRRSGPAVVGRPRRAHRPHAARWLPGHRAGSP